MKLVISIALTIFLIASSLPYPEDGSETAQVRKISFELSDSDKERIDSRLQRIAERDQQFRTYLSFGTMDEAKLDRIKKLNAKETLTAMTASKDELSTEVKNVLMELQRRNDRKNHQDLFRLVEEFGYPSSERLGVKSDRLFAVLLHPHVRLEEIEQHTQDVCQRLLPEVEAGRMPAKLYATFVDNMRGKILGQNQLYGTNQVFDRKTGTILPPLIGDLATTNTARRAIGMPDLEEGQYRLDRQSATKK